MTMFGTSKCVLYRDVCVLYSLLYTSCLYYSVQWVCPRQSTTLDTVLDAAQSSAGQLVGVGRGGDVRWWRVREEEEEGEEGAGLVVEVLAVLKKTDMSSELGRFGYGKNTEVSWLYLLHVANSVKTVHM